MIFDNLNFSKSASKLTFSFISLFIQMTSDFEEMLIFSSIPASFQALAHWSPYSKHFFIFLFVCVGMRLENQISERSFLICSKFKVLQSLISFQYLLRKKTFLTLSQRIKLWSGWIFFFFWLYTHLTTEVHEVLIVKSHQMITVQLE